MKVTSRFPESIIEPRVGHEDACNGLVEGAYDTTSTPAAVYTEPNVETGTLLMLTISIESTVRMLR